VFKLNSYNDVISIMGLFTEIDIRDLAFVNKMAGARTAVCRRSKHLYLDSEELAFLAGLKVQTVNNLKVRGVDGMPREPKGIVTTYIDYQYRTTGYDAYMWLKTKPGYSAITVTN
jgi:hypothetical protein